MKVDRERKNTKASADNCFYENDNCELEIKCILPITNIGENNKEIADNIVKVIMKKDGHSYK